MFYDYVRKNELIYWNRINLYINDGEKCNIFWSKLFKKPKWNIIIIIIYLAICNVLELHKCMFQSLKYSTVLHGVWTNVNKFQVVIIRIVFTCFNI